MKRLTLLALALMSLATCVKPEPPAPTPARPATEVAASFDVAWDAVIDHFAAANIPIATIEKASGIIATSRMSVTPDDAEEFADCGRIAPTTPVVASSVVYNVLVRGDEQGSTVRVTASWDTDREGAPFTCQSTGIWEDGVEQAVKERAEETALTRGSPPR